MKSKPTSRVANLSTRLADMPFKAAQDATFRASRAAISMSWDCRWRSYMSCLANWIGGTTGRLKTKRAATLAALANKLVVNQAREIISFPQWLEWWWK